LSKEGYALPPAKSIERFLESDLNCTLPAAGDRGLCRDATFCGQSNPSGLSSAVHQESGHQNRRPSTLNSLICFTCIVGLIASAPQGISSPNLDLARQLNQAFVEVAEKVSPAVVVITVTQKTSTSVTLEGLDEVPEGFPREFWRQFHQEMPENSIGQGSGVIIRENGYILTNRHVVEDAETIEVRLRDGRRFKAVVRGVDPQSDVAVIKIDARGLPVARLADSAKTRVGEFAIAIGAPFQLDYSVTFGHVSAKSRANVVPAFLSGGLMDQDFIQTDANINPGNSGGPLVNIDGEVIGINTLIRGLRTGIGFAIPSSLANEVSEQLIAKGKFIRPWLGVAILGLKEDAEPRERIKGVDDGVVIQKILPDGPAAKSELRRNDIIATVDGRRVTTTQELRNEIRGKKIGEPVTLDVYRPQAAGDPRRLTVKVSPAEYVEKPVEIVVKKSDPPPKDAPAPTVDLGLTVKPLTADLAEKFSVVATEGVMVATVEKTGPADSQGIKPGDVITAVNHQPITRVREFRNALRDLDLKKGVLLNLVSGNTARFEILKDKAE
jgi:serine protease Do